jgi:hypothetical protein
MRLCVGCGHELGVGRFCTNCGRPVGQSGSATDTAERPAVRTVPTAPALHRRPGRPWGVWTTVAVVLLLVAGVGTWLLLAGDEDQIASGGPPAASSVPTTTHDATPSSDPATPDASPEPPAGDVATDSTVRVPATAPPGEDVAGNAIDYSGDNMLDGVPETTWRMAGDGSGAELTVTLPRKTRLRSVGLINGYAKTARDPGGRELDWYHGNRRVESVEWVFDDGTVVPQDLGDTPAVQNIDVDVTTTTVVLRLVTVSAPGAGRAGRDYTAVSDLSLVAG